MSDFLFKGRETDYKREHYHKNREEYRARARQRKQKLREWFEEYKSNLSCIRCGENHPCCLDFHHRDPSQKDDTISQAVRSVWSVDRILAEIEKCDVLCSNCHRKVHYELGYRNE